MELMELTELMGLTKLSMFGGGGVEDDVVGGGGGRGLGLGVGWIWVVMYASCL